MEEKHISETHYLSLKEMVKSYAQSKWLYINRAFSSHCHYCIIDGDIYMHLSQSVMVDVQTKINELMRCD